VTDEPAVSEQEGGQASTNVENPFHCEVIGSLLRPEPLKEAMQRAETGEISQDELDRLQEEDGERAIRLQEECGIEVVTDGEVRRRFWFDPLTASLGYNYQASAPVPFTAGGQRPDEAPPKLPVVTERLRIVENLPLREYLFVREHARTPTKTTIAGMTYASVLWVPGVSEGSYRDRDEYMADVLRLMKKIVSQVVEAGTHYVQLDSPRYTHLVSDEGRANLRKVGLDVQTWLDRMIALDNELMAAFPQVTFGVHLCRGNHRSMWSVEGGYDAIAEQLFGRLACDRFLAEYDSPRAGSFEPLRFVPKNKVVVLGLVTTKEPALEDEDQLKRRIDEAARYVPLERLALSPQCGFASTMPGNLVTAADQRAKLQLVARVARAVWG
jgi:5-methyltetrahydropteroyltriglutamate--homocysteine methyltransferase